MTKGKREIWTIKAENITCCFSCNEVGHISRVGPDIQSRRTGVCCCSRKEGHVTENCLYKKVNYFKCEQIGHLLIVFNFG